MLIEERINYKFEKLRFCRSHCVHGTFKYKNTCIKSCPSNLKFIEDGACVRSCKLNTLHQKVYNEGRLVGIKCNDKCRNASNNPFQLSNECVSKCKENQVAFDGKCLGHCPYEAHIVVNLDVCIEMGKCLQVWPEQKYCSETCPENNYVYKSSCVSTCPDNALYSSNGHCMENCPKNKMYKYLNTSSSRLGNVTECYEVCPYPSLAYNFTCIHECPTGLKSYNRKCVPNCPNDTFVEEFFTGGPTCVTECSRKYIHGNLCMDSCPDDSKYISDSHCLSECPKSKKYTLEDSMYTFENSFICLKNCPENKMIHKSKNKCVTNCPSGTSEYKRTCLDECPQNTSKQIVSIGKTICVDRCAKFRNNRTCVDSCPQYSVKRICVEKCPSEFNVMYGTSCYSTCPTGTCLMDNGINCTDNCYLDTKSEQLVSKCPHSAPYNRRYFTENHCVESCEKHEVLDTLRCINVTDCKRAVLSDGKCEDECPEGYLYTSFNTNNLNEWDTQEYQYTMENIKNSPCMHKASVYFMTFMLGLFTIMYWLLFAIFLSPFQSNRGSCLSGKTHVQGEEELNDQDSFENLLQDESTAANGLQDDRRLTEEELDDVPLLNLATENVENSDGNSEQVCKVDIHTDINDCENVPLLEAK